MPSIPGKTDVEQKMGSCYLIARFLWLEHDDTQMPSRQGAGRAVEGVREGTHVAG